MTVATRAFAALRRVGIVIAVAIAFIFGLGTTVYLSLRSPEVTVPDVIGKDRFDAEHILARASLNFRVRATRPSAQVKPDVVLFQLPRAGEVVKAGQTVAMDISRIAKQGEAAEGATPENKASEEKPADNRNLSAAQANIGENKPKRNKNANENSNFNSNQNTANRNTALRPSNENVNDRNVNATANHNANRGGENFNANSGRNINERPRPAAPKPSPAGNANPGDSLRPTLKSP